MRAALIRFAMIAWGMLGPAGYGQNTHVIYLNPQEQQRLRESRPEHPRVDELCDSIISAARAYLDDRPIPLAEIFYEGMLESDTARIRTTRSLLDMDKVSTMFYASYCQPDPAYGKKIREYVLAWSRNYKPTGNTINENKFIPLMWGYYLFRTEFSASGRAAAEAWMNQLAIKQIERPRTPNNNWMAKRLRLIALVGIITENQAYMDFALAGFKEFINTAYFPDSTSRDLRQRDALHYHVSGLKAIITPLINMPGFDPRFDLFDYVTPSGGSIRKSVAFTYPYATGEKIHREWVHTTVKLDKERAAAGLPQYQPGMIFDPEKAHSLFEFAVFFNAEWYRVLDPAMKHPYAVSWIALLNSPSIRDP